MKKVYNINNYQPGILYKIFLWLTNLRLKAHFISKYSYTILFIVVSLSISRILWIYEFNLISFIIFILITIFTFIIYNSRTILIITSNIIICVLFLAAIGAVIHIILEYPSLDKKLIVYLKNSFTEQRCNNEDHKMILGILILFIFCIFFHLYSINQSFVKLWNFLQFSVLSFTMLFGYVGSVSVSFIFLAESMDILSSNNSDSINIFSLILIGFFLVNLTNNGVESIIISSMKSLDYKWRYYKCNGVLNFIITYIFAAISIVTLMKFQFDAVKRLDEFDIKLKFPFILFSGILYIIHLLTTEYLIDQQIHTNSDNNKSKV